MSHFTTVRTHIRDVECLKSALNYYDFKFEEGICFVKDYRGNSCQVNLAIRTGTAYDIGFRMNEDDCEIIADWWGVEKDTNLKEKQTVDKIRQRYAYEKILKEQTNLEQKGFMVAKEEVTKENVVMITLRHY
ncbi:DUF1257 domain-containing protein [candidate division KSB1 bacterium]|nr:DUF1257 domain-containing protein [candidate division KSB1 bacterium]